MNKIEIPERKKGKNWNPPELKGQKRHNIFLWFVKKVLWNTFPNV